MDQAIMQKVCILQILPVKKLFKIMIQDKNKYDGRIRQIPSAVRRKSKMQLEIPAI